MTYDELDRKLKRKAVEDKLRERAEANLARHGVEKKSDEHMLVMRLLVMCWGHEEHMDKAALDRAIDMFDALVRGAALPPAGQDGHRWEPARPGQLVVRDVVRVRLDAYPGPTGDYHNGRQGPVVAIRHGDVHVMYDDGGPKPDLAARHSPHKLEKRIS